MRESGAIAGARGRGQAGEACRFESLRLRGAVRRDAPEVMLIGTTSAS
jgi:hypothetical protein